ncbi:unnamed protein product [Penicillium salamii]|nr:unnamed protein product [Penicillium salamii]
MSPVQQYWLPGYGLSRHIVLGHIHYFLGPSATARPFCYQGREGYMIVGVPLTRVCAPDIDPDLNLSTNNYIESMTDLYHQEQIDDLTAMSREYEKQEATRMTHNSSNNSNASASSENSTNQSNEPYINEIIPVNPPGPRRRTEPESRGGR